MSMIDLDESLGLGLKLAETIRSGLAIRYLLTLPSDSSSMLFGEILSAPAGFGHAPHYFIRVEFMISTGCGPINRIITAVEFVEGQNALESVKDTAASWHEKAGRNDHWKPWCVHDSFVGVMRLYNSPKKDAGCITTLRRSSPFLSFYTGTIMGALTSRMEQMQGLKSLGKEESRKADAMGRLHSQFSTFANQSLTEYMQNILGDQYP